MWLSEIGLTVQQFDPADGSADDTRWWRCLRAWMARHDIDWGFWALQVRLDVYQRCNSLGRPHWRRGGPWDLGLLGAAGAAGCLRLL